MTGINRKSVLIADDDPLMRNNIRRCLHGSEFDVLGEASDGVDAVEKCRILKPDVVLLDIGMPVLDGVCAARMMTEQQLTKCVIMLTSYEDRTYVHQAIEAGAAGYLIKPADTETITATIQVCLTKVREYRDSQKKLDKLKRRTEDDQVVNRAKLCLMEQRGMTESSAHAFLNEFSRRKNISQKQAAEYFLKSMERK
jgi:AmiR/NasT family two-component response regulator